MTRFARPGFLWLIALAAASAMRATECDGFSVMVLVDGSPRPEYTARGRTYVEALEGKEFTIRLSNSSSRRVAVALSVDGRNVVDAKRTTAREATKWILEPGQTAEIPGWQISGETSRRFFFTATSRSYAKWLGDTANAGTIEAVFFREKARPPILAGKDAPASQAPEAAAGAPDSPSPTTSMRARESDSYAATGIGDRTRFPVRWVAFEEEPTPASRIAIRYEFRPELIRLGVIRATEELFARDAARGFEHEYAPEPDRRR